jgi:hypothetical protein
VQLTCGSRRDLGAFFWFRVFSTSQALSTPAPPPLTQTVETVEKVPFQKLIFEKWDRDIEKRLVFYVSNNILTIFEPFLSLLWEFFVKIFCNCSEVKS